MPTVNRAFWSFSIVGQVRHPAIWSFDELLSLPMQNISAAQICSAYARSGTVPKVVKWRGVALRSLLQAVEVEPSAIFARIHCADSYTIVVHRSALDDAMIACERNDSPLSISTGFPSRLIIPGCFGYKQAKWVERIEMIEEAVGGFWEDRGYAVEGQIMLGTQATFLWEHNVLTIKGRAFAREGVRDIEVSINDADWMPTLISSQVLDSAGIAMMDWQVHWRPPYRGMFGARIRVSDSQNRQSPQILLTLKAE